MRPFPPRAESGSPAYCEHPTPHNGTDGPAVIQRLLGNMLYSGGAVCYPVSRTIEISDELAERMEDHLREDEPMEEFIEELVNIYEQEGRFTDEGL